MKSLLNGLTFTAAGILLAALMAGPHIHNVKAQMWNGGFWAGKTSCMKGGGVYE